MKLLSDLYPSLIEAATVIKKEDSNPGIVNALKNALREELNAWYGYVIVREWLTGHNRKDIEDFYMNTADDELEDHAYWLMKRIAELGGDIEDIALSPASWAEADHKYIQPTWTNGEIDIVKSLQDNIRNEEGAIETYKNLVRMTEDIDPVTNSKMKEILADEQEHLKELKDFLSDMK
jgi:bacterioferritin